MTDGEENLWARRPRDRHADLYDAEYAKQLERIARIRSEVSASLPGLAGDRAAADARDDETRALELREGSTRGVEEPRAGAGGDRRREAAGVHREALGRAGTVPVARQLAGARPGPALARWDAVPVELASEPPRARVSSTVVPVAVPAAHGGAADSHDRAPSAPGHTRRKWFAAALVAALAAVATALLFARDPKPAAATIFRVPGQPTGLVADGDRVWVAGPAAGEVWVLDHLSGRPVAPALRIGGTPARLALEPRFAWIADTEHGSVIRAPRQGNGTLRTIRTGPDLADVTVAGGRVWTASSADGTVRSIDARGRREVLRVGVRPIALAGDARRVVVLDAIGALVRIDASTRRESGPPIQLGGEPVDVALAGDVAWVADMGAGTVRAVRVSSGIAGPPIAVGTDPVAVAADGRDVYVLCRAPRTLVRLGPDGALRERLSLEHAPTALALDSRHVWIAAGTNEVIRVDR